MATCQGDNGTMTPVCYRLATRTSTFQVQPNGQRQPRVERVGCTPCWAGVDNAWEQRKPKPENCPKTATNPRRPLHAVLGSCCGPSEPVSNRIRTSTSH